MFPHINNRNLTQFYISQAVEQSSVKLSGKLCNSFFEITIKLGMICWKRIIFFFFPPNIIKSTISLLFIIHKLFFFCNTDIILHL